jgi:hypothetical protein
MDNRPAPTALRYGYLIAGVITGAAVQRAAQHHSPCFQSDPAQSDSAGELTATVQDACCGTDGRLVLGPARLVGPAGKHISSRIEDRTTSHLALLVGPPACQPSPQPLEPADTIRSSYPPRRNYTGITLRLSSRPPSGLGYDMANALTGIIKGTPISGTLLSLS